jgi:predicted dehydrogenase
VELISVCAQHKENAEFYGKKYGAQFYYDNFDRMIGEQRHDLIITAVNAKYHPEIIKSSLSKDVPIFTEKPIASSTADIKKLIDLDKDNKVMVGFQKRFAPNYQIIKNAIDNKTYGELHSLHLEFGVGAFDGGIENFLVETGIHFIDLMRYFVPDPQIETILIKEIKKGQINCNIVFSAANDVIGNLYLSSNFDWSNCHERVLVNFEKENISVNNLVDFSSKGNSKTILSIPMEQVSKKRIVREIWHPNYVSGDMVNSSQFQAGFLPELKHFCKWVGGEGKNSISNLQNAFETHQLIEKILDT